ncbi:MAG: PCMD domain-containing protein [Bacteroidales bacterium]|nr:PCMD domain-containing protein [Bacteroidales bacterium]
MKRTHFLLMAALIALCTGCIKEEAPNAEADIIECWLEGDIMSRAAEIGNDTITLFVKSGTKMDNLAPHFRLTEGATIEPKSGTALSFVTPQYYTVTSQDGQWRKRYGIRITTGEMPFGGESSDEITEIAFDFEHVKSKSNYPVFYEVSSTGENLFDWSSGNAGFALTGMASSDADYPTHQNANGYDGACAELTTCRTGFFGEMSGKPLAAGNLFLGNFNMSRALTAPLEATQFGMMFKNVPDSLSGWINYTPGETYYEPDGTGKLKAVSDKRDQCSLYAIFFEATEEAPYVTGDNPLSATNPNIISTAELPEAECNATNGWVPFKIPFVMRAGKTVDAEKLKAGKYSLAIIFSSSSGGAEFKGAIGSRLQIDRVRLKVKAQ